VIQESLFDTAGKLGSYEWMLRVSDGKETVEWKMVIEVKEVPPAPNTKPIAKAQSVMMDEDQEQVIMLAGTDADGNALSYVIVSQPVSGKLVKQAGDLTGTKYVYTPNGNYSGNDSFTFKVNDGTLDSLAGTVSIMVHEVNDAPVGTLTTLTDVKEDTEKTFTLTGSDVEKSTLTYTIVSIAKQGKVSCAGASCTYIGNGNYSGADSFSYAVKDGTIDSAVVTVNFGVAGVNDAPALNVPAEQTTSQPALYTAGKRE
jgi:VCBS repeat-containing protein